MVKTKWCNTIHKAQSTKIGCAFLLPKIKRGATTYDEEENAADHHILQNAAGQQARRRRKTAQTAWVEAFTKICYNFFEEILKIVKPNPIFVGIYSEGT